MSHLSADSRGVIVPCPACHQGNRIPFQVLKQRIRCGRCKTDLPSIHKVVEVGDLVSFSELVAKSTLPVLVDFWAPWCGPCRSVAPEVYRLAALMSGEALIAKVNTEQLPEIASQHQVQSIPTFVLFARGRESARTSGAMSAARLREFIQHNGR